MFGRAPGALGRCRVSGATAGRCRAAIGLAGAVAVALLAHGPRALAAQQRAERGSGGLLVRIGASVSVGADETAGSIAVINGDAGIDGTVRGNLLVVHGTARVTGRIEGPVVVVNGHAVLDRAARLGSDLVLYRSTVSRTPEAVVAGRTVRESGFSFGRCFLLLAWVGVTVALTVAAAAFAAVGGGLLDRASGSLAGQPGRAILGAAVTFIGLPFVAFLSLLTVVGAAVGVGIVAMLLPGLWLLGYLVAATWLGRRLLPALQAPYDAERPYGAATLGVIAAQVVGLVPVAGGLVVLVAGALGAGVLASLAWTSWRERPDEAVEAELVPIAPE